MLRRMAGERSREAGCSGSKVGCVKLQANAMLQAL
jgi:hypothetical protein